MILQNPWAYDLTRLNPPATPEPTDGIYRIPPFLQDVITLQQAFRNQSPAPGTTTVLRTSTGLNSQADIPASTAASDTTIATLGSGFWDVAIHLACLSNFTVATPSFGTEGLYIALNPPAGNGFIFHAFYLVNAQPQSVQIRRRWLLTEDSWTITIHQSGTGVGQALSWAASVELSRLI